MTLQEVIERLVDLANEHGQDSPVCLNVNGFTGRVRAVDAVNGQIQLRNRRLVDD